MEPSENFRLFIFVLVLICLVGYAIYFYMIKASQDKIKDAVIRKRLTRHFFSTWDQQQVNIRETAKLFNMDEKGIRKYDEVLDSEGKKRSPAWQKAELEHWIGEDRHYLSYTMWGMYLFCKGLGVFIAGLGGVIVTTIVQTAKGITRVINAINKKPTDTENES